MRVLVASAPSAEHPRLQLCFMVWELLELAPVATAAKGKHLAKDEGKHTLEMSAYGCQLLPNSSHRYVAPYVTQSTRDFSDDKS